MKSLWKELRKIETWKELAPWIALGIVAWFFPYGYGFLIFLLIYLAVKFWHEEKDLHKKE